MNLTRAALKHPFAVISLILLVVAMGIFGYFRTPVDLFPETAPPQVLVVTVLPGAVANDVEDKITEVVEKEINTLSGLKNITSTSRDQVSSVKAEFYYKKDLGQAVLDVQNAIGRIRADLPETARQPRVYRVTESSTNALLTLALSPEKQRSQNPAEKSLSEVRLLAENQIEDRLLRLKGVADVDIVGGHKPEVKVNLDRDKMIAHGLFLEDVIRTLAQQNISIPAGTIYSGANEYMFNVNGELNDLGAIRHLPLKRDKYGLLRLSDVAEVSLDEEDPNSLYHGNNRSAIGLNILQSEGGKTVATIERIKEMLPRLKQAYPDIRFDITDDQQPLIDLNMAGMRNSIIQAILLTVLVIFVFLADTRAALVVSISIPLSFMCTIGVLWLTPYTLNMITLSGVIVAIGMVVDSSIVALENIFRKYQETENPDAETAAEEGAHEIALPITASIITTVAVLVPVIFIGGYAQRTIGRLSFVIAVTVIAALVVALTVVPLIASRLLSHPHRRKNIAEKCTVFVDQIPDNLTGT